MQVLSVGEHVYIFCECILLWGGGDGIIGSRDVC